MRKYEFTGVTKQHIKGKTLHQIRAICDFGFIHAGDVGGYIEKEENLSHAGTSWVHPNAIVCGDARVYEDAVITGNAEISGEAHIFANATVGGNTHVKGTTWICRNARIKSNDDFVTVTGLGENKKTITAFLNRDEEIVIFVQPDYLGDIPGYLSYVTDEYGNSQISAEAYELTELIKLHFGKR